MTPEEELWPTVQAEVSAFLERWHAVPADDREPLESALATWLSNIFVHMERAHNARRRSS